MISISDLSSFPEIVILGIPDTCLVMESDAAAGNSEKKIDARYRTILIGAVLCVIPHLRFNVNDLIFHGTGRNAVIPSVHKFRMLPVVAAVLSKTEDKKIPELVPFASLFFTVCFLHMLIMQDFYTSFASNCDWPGISSAAVFLPLCSGLTFRFLQMFSRSLKILCGKRSRSLIRV